MKRWTVGTLAVLWGCASIKPLPAKYRDEGLEGLRMRMQRAAPAWKSYSAELRITYHGPKKRFRSNAILVVKRPAMMRLDVEGPHGQVLEAFATNGNELASLNMGKSSYVHGPATEENVRLLLWLVPEGMKMSSLVGMLFGSVEVPDNAQLRYVERKGEYVLRWASGHSPIEIHVDPITARVRRLDLGDGSRIVIEQYAENGLPSRIAIRIPSREQEVDLKIRDVVAEPTLDESVFALDPPSGVTIERL